MFVKRIYLYCDGGGKGCLGQGYEADLAESDYSTIAAYKETKIQEGWIFRKGNKAYCPACAKMPKER